MASRRGERYVGPYEILMSSPKYENPWVKVREDSVRHTSGQESAFCVVDMRPRVTVLPLDEDENVHLVREFKYALCDTSLEAMSGPIESGETPEQAGLREIGGQADLVASEWIDFGTIDPFTTVVHCPNHLFLARGLSRLRRSSEASTESEIAKMSFEDALHAVLGGEIIHGASCVLILKTHLFLSRSKQR